MERLREDIKRIIVENLKDNYFCNRGWSAWSYGTMTEDDFSPSEESDSIDDFAEEIIKLINEPKHETVEQWEARTGETYPGDGPVWWWDGDTSKFCLSTYGSLKEYIDFMPIEDVVKIVANHHGKPNSIGER